jgi:four helix bundle protein
VWHTFATSKDVAFIFEKLIVYQKSLTFVEEIQKLRHERERQIPHSVMDQLFRASLSVPLNIAEGNGRWHEGEKRNFFRIARGSVFECVPLIQLLRRSRCISDQEYMALYRNLEELSKMVTGLVQRFEGPKDP